MHISTETIIVIVFFLFGSAVIMAWCLYELNRFARREEKWRELVGLTKDYWMKRFAHGGKNEEYANVIQRMEKLKKELGYE